MVCLVCFIKLYQKQNVYDIPDIHYHYENTNYLFNINQWILNSKISRRIKTLPDGNNDIRTWMRSCVHGYGDVRTWMRSCVHGYRALELFVWLLLVQVRLSESGVHRVLVVPGHHYGVTGLHRGVHVHPRIPLGVQEHLHVSLVFFIPCSSKNTSVTQANLKSVW